MQTTMAALVLLSLNIVGFASAIFVNDVCEPGQRAVSQFGEGPSTFDNATTLSSEETLLSGFTHFSHGLADQYLDPEHLRHVEPVKDIHPDGRLPSCEDPIKELHPGYEPLFIGGVGFHHQEHDIQEVVFNEEHHVSGEVCNMTAEFQYPGEITSIQHQHGLLLPTKAVAKVAETGVAHPTAPLEEEPTGKVRRLLKVVKLAKRVCATYS